MKKGVCKLCLRHNVDLLNSHFLPRSVYSLLRTDEYEPVFYSSKSAYPGSKQTKDCVFCCKCEQLFSKQGENWVAPLLPKLAGRFPLRERLVKQAPLQTDGKAALFIASSNAEIDVPKLTHFAVGCFYKASVHPWSGRIDRDAYMPLPAEDVEGLRLYLNGQANLPTSVALMVTVDSLPTVWQAAVYPYRAEPLLGFRRYLFYVPGILFQLMIGNDVQNAFKWCINGHANHPVIVTDVSHRMRDASRAEVKNAHQTVKLKETWAEIENRGLGVRLGD